MPKEYSKTILGIDPGTNLLGYGVVSVDNNGPKFVDMGVLDLRKEKDAYRKLGLIYEKISWLIDYYEPSAVACESPFYGKNAQVILKLGRAQGAAITAAATFTKARSYGVFTAKQSAATALLPLREKF